MYDREALVLGVKLLQLDELTSRNRFLGCGFTVRSGGP